MLARGRPEVGAEASWSVRPEEDLSTVASDAWCGIVVASDAQLRDQRRRGARDEVSREPHDIEVALLRRLKPATEVKRRTIERSLAVFSRDATVRFTRCIGFAR